MLEIPKTMHKINVVTLINVIRLATWNAQAQRPHLEHVLTYTRPATIYIISTDIDKLNGASN